MFSSSVQPGILTLFSSTGTDPLGLFEIHAANSGDPTNSVKLVHDADTVNDSTATTSSAVLGYSLQQTVLSISSPNLPATFIRCPPVPHRASDKPIHLGLKHPWLSFEVRNMFRDWSFECGIVDTGGREGILRASTFQRKPRLDVTTNGTPLLHIPFLFPTSSVALTTWTTFSLHLPVLLTHFSSGALKSNGDDSGESSGWIANLPKGKYSHLSYVKVYANCRLRRIWTTETNIGDSSLPWEFRLYGL